MRKFIIIALLFVAIIGKAQKPIDFLSVDIDERNAKGLPVAVPTTTTTPAQKSVSQHPVSAGPKGVLTGIHFVDGNHAACEGALAAGCRFIAGYPITPSTEVVERFSQRAPKIGATFEDLSITPEELAAAAARDGIRGYVLYCGGKAVAYYFCREQEGNLLYVHSAYDPQHAKLSPGTVLLWLILESLFAEQRFEYFDFLWGYYPYKEAFSRTAIRVACVYSFRGTLRNRALVLTHWALLTLTKWMRAATSRLGVADWVRALGEKLIRRT